MARPKKEGLDYFPLDIDMDQDDKIALIEAKHGLIGFSIVVKLFMKIYKNGYFIEWSEKEQLLFSNRINVDINTLNEIINDCINWCLFDENVYKNFNSLTSKGIQARYMEAILRRKETTFIENLLLIDPMDYVKNSRMKIKIINKYNNVVNADINTNNANNNPQSKSNSKSESNILKEDEDEQAVPLNPQKSIIDMLINNNLIPPGGITETLAEDLRDIFDNFSFTDPYSVIEFAIKDCSRGNGRTWKFVYTRLNYYKNQGVKTVQDIKNLESREQFGRQQRHKRSNQHPLRTEVTPTWFDDDQTKSQNKQEVDDPVILEAKKKEIQEILNAYRSG